MPAICLSALAATPLVGGQAVMEGVMMRHKDTYAIAVRQADGTILVERRPWFSLTRLGLFKLPFVRGFPTFLETLVNGIKALNRSATTSAEEGEELRPWQLVLLMVLSLAMAVGLFVIAPHLLSIVMGWLGLGGDLNSISFHLWDGLFKFAIFVSYILAISLLPEIRRVFRYHGAEHKVIRAFEAGGEVSATSARRFSRLHPRCGTTFLLFVLAIAIILHTILVPLLLHFWTPANAVTKHLGTLGFKLLLMIPISAVAYELIHYAARLDDSFLGGVLRAPGMVLQFLTTWEPHEDEVEVAVAALSGALGDEAPAGLKPPPFTART